MKTLWGYDTSKTLNENLIKEFKGYSPDGTVTKGGTTGSGTGGGTKRKNTTTSQYKTCAETFPISKFCNNAKIKEIQVKLGMEKKYQTGNFGPLTEKAILAKIPDFKVAEGITQDVYNKIMGVETKPKSADDEYIDVTSQDKKTSQSDNDVVDIPNSGVDATTGDEGT